MKNLLKKSEAALGTLVTLKHTHKITKDDLDLPEWWILDEHYDHATNTYDRLLVSIYNSILTQRRLVFCLTRDATQELLKNDKNWSEETGFSPNMWKQYLAHIQKCGLKEVRKGTGKMPSIFEITDPDVLSLLKADRDAQLAQCIEFADKFDPSNKGYVKGYRFEYRNGYVAGSREKEAESVKLEADSMKQEAVKEEKGPIALRLPATRIQDVRDVLTLGATLNTNPKLTIEERVEAVSDRKRQLEAWNKIPTTGITNPNLPMNVNIDMEEIDRKIAEEYESYEK